MPLVTSGIIGFIAEYPTPKPIPLHGQTGLSAVVRRLFKESSAVDGRNCASQKTTPAENEFCPVLELVQLAGGEIIDIEHEYPDYKKEPF